LLRQARTGAPSLQESQANLRVARGEAEQAGARPNPTVGLEVEDVGGSGAYSGLSRSQTTLSVNHTLELGGKRGARIEAGRAAVTAAEAQTRQAEAEFAYELALAYVAAEIAQARADLVAADLARAQEDLRATRALVQAGREADLRAVQADAAVSAVQADLATARADAADTLGRLSALVGAPAAFTSIGPSLLGRARDLPLAGTEAPANTPAVAAARAERDAAARRVKVERTRATPNLTVSVSVRRLAGDDATTFVGGISAPLPLFDRNRGAVSAASARRDAAEARLRAAELDAEAGWRSAVNRSAAAQASLKAAEAGETAAEDAYRLSRLGYEAGRAPLLEVLNARRALTEAQARTLDARAQRVRAEAALARQAGRIPFGA
jgi:cobalt-zinc-cadmium efflux system outer membrane protein